MQNDILKLKLLKYVEEKGDTSFVQALIRDDVEETFKFYFEESYSSERNAEAVSKIENTDQLIDWCYEKEKEDGTKPMMTTLMIYRDYLDLVLEEVKRFVEKYN